MSLTDEDKNWITEQLRVYLRENRNRITEEIRTVETSLLTEFHKWASPSEASEPTQRPGKRLIWQWNCPSRQTRRQVKLPI
jgi:hypothetical protein